MFFCPLTIAIIRAVQYTYKVGDNKKTTVFREIQWFFVCYLINSDCLKEVSCAFEPVAVEHFNYTSVASCCEVLVHGEFCKYL